MKTIDVLLNNSYVGRRESTRRFLFGERMNVEQITVSGRMPGRIVGTMQSLILELFLPVYTGRKKQMIGIMSCPGKIIRITVDVVKPEKQNETEDCRFEWADRGSLE